MTELYYALRRIGFVKPLRSRQILDRVKSMPCIRCGKPADDPHHFLGSLHSLKSSDLYTVPVCRGCHDIYERNPKENPGLALLWVEHVMPKILEMR